MKSNHFPYPKPTKLRLGGYRRVSSTYIFEKVLGFVLLTNPPNECEDDNSSNLGIIAAKIFLNKKRRNGILDEK